MVAQVAENRSIQQNKPICSIVLDGYQFSWARSYQPRYRFINNNAMLKYYHITESGSWLIALTIAAMPSFKTSNALYYHDKSIDKFKFNDKLKVVATTKSFIFYRDK